MGRRAGRVGAATAAGAVGADRAGAPAAGEGAAVGGREFYDKVEAHPELEWLGARRGADPASDEVHVGYGRTGAKFAVPVEAILTREWDELEAVLTGRRPGRVLVHQTRIVGYFSQVHNWNRSKHAELADRQNAPHVIGGEFGAPDGIPDEVVQALIAGGAEAVCDARRS